MSNYIHLQRLNKSQLQNERRNWEGFGRGEAKLFRTSLGVSGTNQSINKHLLIAYSVTGTKLGSGGIKTKKNTVPVFKKLIFYMLYFCLLLVIFLIELVAGVLAHLYYQKLSDELKQHLNQTLTENYGQPKAKEITYSVDQLQQDFRCCGSNSSADWEYSTYIQSPDAEGRKVPDSCCKTVVVLCGQRAHPSNIYKVEGGCITKLEHFLANHLLLMGAVGIGIACLQICGMVLTCCLYARIQLQSY
ncbi:tetraspanin-11 isoform X2 [Notamacropus eugenii]|uniref:tetraspanin-11 isoform X2 n=1 Tax=Notamacropus eugenii TaxID=9315 RepID=UPI003B66C849